MKKIIFLIACAMSFFVFWGCANKPAVTITNENDGSSISVNAGKVIEIKLLGQMGTGYSWQWVANDEFFVQEKDPEVTPVGKGNDLVGGQDNTVFRLKAQKAGETELNFIYGRHWEKKPPEKKYKVKVVILETK